MVICKIISLGIKHIAIFNVRSFLCLPIKLYNFFKFLTLSCSLNYTIVIVEENLFFQCYVELNSLWTIHCKLSLDRKDQNLVLYLWP